MNIKYLAILAIVIGGLSTTQNAEAYWACATPTGVHPMPNTFPNPGAPCGNGWDFGHTVWVPQGGFPGNQGGRVQVPGVPGLTMSTPNTEAQIAMMCAQGGGDPMTVATCAAAGWSVNEIQKCANGFGVSGGCFGPNNTIRRTFEDPIGTIEDGINDLVESLDFEL